MPKIILSVGVFLTSVWLAGCHRHTPVPRFEGRVVSHVDTYGSGTGGSADLSSNGSMTSGFDYGDPARPDWSSDIRWSFLRQDEGKDVYRVEWTFRPKNGTSRTQVTEVSFDGSQSAKIPGNEWQIISIEPKSSQGKP
jgi:hypothetical protein